MGPTYEYIKRLAELAKKIGLRPDENGLYTVHISKEQAATLLHEFEAFNAEEERILIAQIAIPQSSTDAVRQIKRI